MKRICPICESELVLVADSPNEEELDCRVCGASYASLKGTGSFDVEFPGVTCPACSFHDVEGHAIVVRPFSALTWLQKGDFVFQCPRTGRRKDVTFGERGLEVRLF